MSHTRNLTRIFLKTAGLLLLIVILPVVLFLCAAAIGAYIPRNVAAHSQLPDQPSGSRGGETVTIYLLTSPLHADIALPFDVHTRAAFPWLDETRLPLDNPNLAYFGFGWGSKAFYTTAGNYSDIGIANTFTAVTGDDAVMRVIGLGQIEVGETVIPITLNLNKYKTLIENVTAGFDLDANSNPIYLPQFSIGANDAFYAGTGHFNILNPCNQWAADVLFASGIEIGRWTPTTYSLLISLKWNGEIE
jgi:uncharacterized protein (TIGR02117 family)